MEFFKERTTRTNCPLKGDASYYSLEVNGLFNKNAAWYYPSASRATKPIEGHVAFWKGVQIIE